MADPFFSALGTQGYYERLANDNGGLEKALSFARYFPVPARNHCASGPALDDFDALGATSRPWARMIIDLILKETNVRGRSNQEMGSRSLLRILSS